MDVGCFFIYTECSLLQGRDKRPDCANHARHRSCTRDAQGVATAGPEGARARTRPGRPPAARARLAAGVPVRAPRVGGWTKWSDLLPACPAR